MFYSAAEIYSLNCFNVLKLVTLTEGHKWSHDITDKWQDDKVYLENINLHRRNNDSCIQYGNDSENIENQQVFTNPKNRINLNVIYYRPKRKTSNIVEWLSSQIKSNLSPFYVNSTELIMEQDSCHHIRKKIYTKITLIHDLEQIFSIWVVIR